MYNLYKSDKPDKKYKIVITNPSNETARKKTIYFGSSSYEDYTMHKDKERKRRYIKRHSGYSNGKKIETGITQIQLVFIVGGFYVINRH